MPSRGAKCVRMIAMLFNVKPIESIDYLKMSKLDEKALMVITAKSQADKAINSLKGILLGLVSDGVVNESELVELQKWVEEHRRLIGLNPFHEFMNVIDECTAGRMALVQTIDDLYWLCQKFEHDHYYYNAVTADLQTLQGLCHGILADGVINEHEVFDLHNWLQSNEHLSSYYPYDELRSLVLTIVSDKRVDEEEVKVLKAYFNQFVKLHDLETRNIVSSETGGIAISALCSSEPKIEFEGKLFCITGILKRCDRNELQEEIVRKGGLIAESLTRKTDYLIVGDNGNPAWAFSCYGRKVEKALALRKEGHTIMIVHEYDFADVLDDLNFN